MRARGGGGGAGGEAGEGVGVNDFFDNLKKNQNLKNRGAGGGGGMVERLGNG